MKVIYDSIVNADTDFIAHQVNCKGQMGSGVALAIKQKWGKYLDNYFITCKAFARESNLLLGTYIKSPVPNDQCIINLFGQDGYGYDKVYTVEHALQQALISFCNELPDDRVYTCAIPYKIACGRGGGNWPSVHQMLEQVQGSFSNKIEFILYRID